jgi:hypothetical protein
MGHPRGHPHMSSSDPPDTGSRATVCQLGNLTSLNLYQPHETARNRCNRAANERLAMEGSGLEFPRRAEPT